jgi:galactokinase
MKATKEALKKAFASAVGRPAAGVVRAPGRVNLIGEHTDYNDGFVLPIAIERHTLGAWAARPDRKVTFRSTQAEQAVEIDLDAELAPAEPKWANYCKGVAAGLKARGVGLAGCDVMFTSDVPLGGGLSSSASLEVATARALIAAASASSPPAAAAWAKLPPRELAFICQQAEHKFAGAPCGIMDQSIAILGQAGRALLLDCRNGETTQIPFDDPGLVLLVADTQVKHAISDGGYAARRKQCEAAAKKLHLPALRDADAAAVTAAGESGLLKDKELMRARHVVGEIARTLDAVGALQAGDYDRFGQLMYASHASLRDDYEVSCEELDAIVELAQACKGVHGARMTGGGFGGCAIILAAASRAEQIEEAVAAGFDRRFQRRCPIFATRAAAGAEVLE